MSFLLAIKFLKTVLVAFLCQDSCVCVRVREREQDIF